MLVENGRIAAAGKLREAIVKAACERPRGRFVHPDIDAAATVERDHTQIVDTVALVGMVMRHQHAVDPIDVCVKQLVAHVGRCIDQHRGLLAFVLIPLLDEQRATTATVARLPGVAGTPVIADARDAARRTATENGGAEFHDGNTASRGTREKRRRKFSDVCSASSPPVMF